MLNLLNPIAGWIATAILLLIQLTWFASRLWWKVKKTREDLDGLGQRVSRNLDGLGQRVSRLGEEAEERYLALCLVVLCPEKREEVAKLLQNWKRP